MENPRYWNRLTASLAVASLRDAETAWAFVRDEGLVLDEPGNREQFLEAVREVYANDITGPTPAARVAVQMLKLGIAVRAPSEQADPSGEKAKARLKLWRAARAQSGTQDR